MKRGCSFNTRVLHPISSATVLMAMAVTTAAVAQDFGDIEDQHREPLVLQELGSFFVDGETKNRGPDDDVTIHQMYVEYQVPKGMPKVPVVMTHGCCLSSKTWETTPDGRMGWEEYFVRKDHPVFLTDQVGRARSGFDATPFNLVREGELPPESQPPIRHVSHQDAWDIFRFGLEFGEPHPGLKFPIEAVEDFWPQMIPDLNDGLPSQILTAERLATLGEQVGGAVLVGHSQSGIFPMHAAAINPEAVKGIVSIEPGGTCHENFGQSEEGNPSQQAIETLTAIPILVMFGDYLEGTSWQGAFEDCQMFVDEINAAGGNATMMHLPALGIMGNSHMLMQDENSLKIADLILEWIDMKVETGVWRRPN